MSHSEANRKGSFLERRIAKLFSKIGFETKLNSKEMGFETDVLARKRGFTIIIEAKQYESYINVKSLLHEWSSKGKSVGVDKTLLIVTGLKNISESDRALAKRLGVYLWDEEVVHNLHDIENKEELYKEIGKKLEFKDIVEELEKKARKVMLIKIASFIVFVLVIFLLLKFYISSEVSSEEQNLLDQESNNAKILEGAITTEQHILPEEESIKPQKNLEKEKTPEEMLESFCINEFEKKSDYIKDSPYKWMREWPKVKSSNFFEDYNSAHEWIRERHYSVSKETEQTLGERGFSVEQQVNNIMRLVEEPRLDKAEFPIVVIDGKYTEQEAVFSSGIFICDKNGILDLNS